MIKFITRPIKRYLLRPIKRNAKKAAITYLLATTPLGYVTTALTSQIPFTNPQAVITQLTNHGSIDGIVNVFTGGLMKPITNSVTGAFGKAQEAIGEWTNNDDLVEAGTKAQDKANKWFNKGKDYLEETKKLAFSTAETLSGKFSTKDQAVDAFAEEFHWDEKVAPNYYVVVGEAQIDPSNFGEPGTIQYSELDSLGRTGVARANLNYKLVSDEKNQSRESFSNKEEERLSGWPRKNTREEIPSTTTNKPYHGNFYNRSHLIADSLGGAAIRRNAITGTRMQNVGEKNTGGMAYMESILRKFFSKETGVTVYYQATPNYMGDEIVPRSVTLDALSSDGTINQRVIVYNTAKGFTIDYNTGNYIKN